MALMCVSKKHQPRRSYGRVFVYSAPVGSAFVTRSVTVYGWEYHLSIEVKPRLKRACWPSSSYGRCGSDV